MMSRRVGPREWCGRAAVPALACAVLFVGPHPPAFAQGGPTAPSYLVLSSGLTTDQAMALGRALGLPADGQIAGGAFQYADPDRFLALPTVPVPPLPGAEDEDAAPVSSEGIDFAAVRALSPPSRLRASRLIRQALRAAGITLPGGRRQFSKTFFDAFTVDGRRWLHHPIASNVSFHFSTPDGTPLVGPGAVAEFSFDSDGKASLVAVATRVLARGPDVPIIPQAEALARCAAGAPPGAAVTASLVHYAPSLAFDVSTIVPHYQCGGSAPTESGDVEQLKVRYVPATLPDGPSGPPTIVVSASADGSVLNAQAEVTGGTPPYSFTWSSAHTPLPPAAGDSAISYDVTSRDPATSVDTVNATVVDGNGLTSSANASVAVSRVGGQLVPVPEPSNRTVGIEYQSWSVGLWGSELTAKAFQIGTAAAVPAVTMKFVEAELMSWETDFRTDLQAGGQDHNYVDNVDLVYYSGHGFPGGFTFSSLRDFTWITAAQKLRLGDRDMEWLALDTCLALNNSDGYVLSRLKPMFTGLHSVLGFDTVAADTSDLGGIFADYLFGTATNPNSHSYGAHLTLVQAWALAAIITNGAGHAWAAMGPYGDLGISDVNDRFWGFGATGPDIRGSAIKGYWRVGGPT
jgi:hypothetical protein